MERETIDYYKSQSEQALEHLIQVKGSLEAARDKFNNVFLPDILNSLTTLATFSEENIEYGINTLASFLKELGFLGFTKTLDFLEAHKAEYSANFYEKIHAAVQKAFDDVFGEFAVGLFETHEEWADGIAQIKANEEAELDKFVEQSGVEIGRKKYVRQRLPMVLTMLEDLKSEDDTNVQVALDALVKFLQRLGSFGFESTFNELRDNYGERLGLVLLQKILEAVQKGWRNQQDMEMIDYYKKNADAILDRLIEETKSETEGRKEFVDHHLQDIIYALPGLKTMSDENVNYAIETSIAFLRRLGLDGTMKTLKFIILIRDHIGEHTFVKLDKAVRKLLEEFREQYDMMETAKEYLEELMLKLARAGLDAAEYLVDKMVAFLKAFGLSALKMAERILEANKCLVGAYVFNMAMGKVKVAIKAAAIGGIVG